MLHLLGREGLRELALKSRAGALHIAEAVEQIPGLRLVGWPESSLVCIGDTGSPDGPDMRIVADISFTSWDGRCRSSPARGGGPTNIHVTVSAGISDRADEFIDVVQRATEAATGRARRHRSQQPPQQLRSMSRRSPDQADRRAAAACRIQG